MLHLLCLPFVDASMAFAKKTTHHHPSRISHVARMIHVYIMKWHTEGIVLSLAVLLSISAQVTGPLYATQATQLYHILLPMQACFRPGRKSAVPHLSLH